MYRAPSGAKTSGPVGTLSVRVARFAPDMRGSGVRPVGQIERSISALRRDRAMRISHEVEFTKKDCPLFLCPDCESETQTNHIVSYANDSDEQSANESLLHSLDAIVECPCGAVWLSNDEVE